MEQLLYTGVYLVARIHTFLLTLNNQYEYYLTDKQLHFIIFGLMGVAMILIIHPIFSWLANNDHTMIISFLYVLTLIVVVAFAIEIGQGITGTGAMEMADAGYGIMGFLAGFVIVAIVYSIIRAIKRHKRK